MQHNNYAKRVGYWYFHNVAEDMPKLDTIVRMEQPDAGTVTFDWFMDNPPTLETLDSYEDGVVDDWVDDYKKTKEASLKDLTDTEKAIPLGLIDCINVRIPNNQITKAELVAAMRQRLNTVKGDEG